MDVRIESRATYKAPIENTAISWNLSFIDLFNLLYCGIGRPRSNASIPILSKDFDEKYIIIVDTLLAQDIWLLYRSNWIALEDTDKSLRAEVMTA